jgi:hypothetical protein
MQEMERFTMAKTEEAIVYHARESGLRSPVFA